MTNDKNANSQNLQTMMNNFSLSRTFSTFTLPENPLPTTINLSPVSLPDTSSPWYAMPVIITPSASQFRF